MTKADIKDMSNTDIIMMLVKLAAHNRVTKKDINLGKALISELGDRNLVYEEDLLEEWVEFYNR